MSLSFQVYAKKWYYTLIMKLMNLIFGMLGTYSFNMSMWYSIQIRPQLQLNAKNGSKMAKNEEQMPGICQKIILHLNYDTYEYNFWHVY